MNHGRQRKIHGISMTTSSRHNATDFPRYRVFPSVQENDYVTQDVNRQLPFLEPLCQQFQTVTGWEISFQPDPSHVPGRTVFGELSITDMSTYLPAGKSACHRQHCDQLVRTLDELVEVIQDDREMLDQSTTCLAPVVDIPFDWWSLAGSAGYCRGQIASWAITDGEKIRLMGGRISGDSTVAQTVGAVSILAAFDALAQTHLSLQQSTRLSRDAIDRTQAGHADLLWLACFEIDPVTGEFQIAGHQAWQGMILVDVDAQTVLPVEDLSGTLTSGQILVLCDSIHDHVAEINQTIRECELTCVGVAELIESLLVKSPILMLYRN